MLRSLAFAALVSIVALLLPRAAWADSPFDGKWVQGPMKETFTVLKWQKECEAPPVSGSSGGGEQIRINTEGDELSFVGGGRVFKTNQCYDQMPTLSRETHTRNPSGREWRTRCATPPSDPRHAVMNTLVVATSSTHIDLIETGRYESQLAGGLCTADVKRSRTFDLVTADTPSAPATAPAPAPTPAPAPVTPTPEPSHCTSPGEPSRLEARPSRKLLRTGESFAFRALVLDAAGCPTHTPATWSLDDHATESKAITVDANGTVTVAADAKEGSYDAIVTAAGKSTHVTVEVTSPSRYDALLQQSGLNDAGENDVASVAVISGAQIGGSDARGDDGSGTRRAIFIAVIVMLALVLGAVALGAARRTKRAALLEREAQERHADKVAAAEARRREKVEKHDAAMRAHEESVEKAKKAAESAASAAASPGMICPTCRREFPSGGGFCPNDATRLVPLNVSPMAVPSPGGSICPTCKRGYEAGVKVCPHDKDELVSYAHYASQQQASGSAAPPRGKICPTCGARYQGVVEFCGKDGTALVLLN